MSSLRGDPRPAGPQWRSRLRLWSGCALVAYVLHLSNHALGLICLDVAEAGRWFSRAVAELSGQGLTKHYDAELVISERVARPASTFRRSPATRSPSATATSRSPSGSSPTGEPSRSRPPRRHHKA